MHDPIIGAVAEIAGNPSWAECVLAWLGTYAVHSAVAAAAFALILRTRPAARLENATARAALFAPMITATLAVVAACSRRIPLARVAIDPVLAVGHPTAAPGPASVSAPTWATLGLAVMAFGALRFSWKLIVFLAAVRGRRPVDDERLLESLERVRLRAKLPPMALSESRLLSTPTLVSGREICLPCGRMTGLTTAELDAVFAHELAHRDRRDDLWFLGAGAVSAVLGWQPTNLWTASRFRRSAELCCDERAVALTGDALALAHALARLAAHAKPRARLAMPAIALSRRAFVVDRIERLVVVGHDPLPPAPARIGNAAVRAVGAILAFAIVPFVVGVAPRGLAHEASRSTYAAPDGEAAVRRMAVLSRRERRLRAEIEALRATAGSDDGRIDEVEQALRHTQQEQAWIERAASNVATP